MIDGGQSSRGGFNVFAWEYRELFPTDLGTAKCARYEIEVSDQHPVRSSLYRCAPPKLRTFKKIVDDL